jgi:hypothetical protein
MISKMLQVIEQALIVYATFRSFGMTLVVT